MARVLAHKREMLGLIDDEVFGRPNRSRPSCAQTA